MSGFLTGFIGLALLGGVLRNQQASDNVGGFLKGIGGFVRWWISPAVPALPIGSFLRLPASTSAAVTGPAPGTVLASSTQGGAA